MGRIWTDDGKFQRWLEVEIAATDTLAERGVVPQEAAARIRERARIDAARVLRLSRACATMSSPSRWPSARPLPIQPPARWLHYGLTSNDVVDTAQALQIREASRMIAAGLERLGEVLEKRAREFQHTPQIGRTHGIHAEPITFGLKAGQLVCGKSPQHRALSRRGANKWRWAKFPARLAMPRTWAPRSRRPFAGAWASTSHP